MSNNIILDDKRDAYSFFELPVKEQESIIADTLRKGTDLITLLLVSKRLLPIIAAAATPVLRETTTDLMHETVVIARGVQSEGSNSNAISIELLDKIRKAIDLLNKATQAIAHANFELKLPRRSDDLLVNLNRLEDNIQKESNENLEKIWSSRLWKALTELPNPQELVIPDKDAPAYAIRAFLNPKMKTPARAHFLEQLKEELDLSCLDLTTLPSAIGQLKGIRALSLRDNRLTEFPAEIINLTHLQALYLGHNQFQKNPEALDSLINQVASLPNLRTLDLSNNNLQRLPDSIVKLTHLQALCLTHNQFQKDPETLDSLIDLAACMPNLRSLDLRNNQLQRLPDTIDKLTNLWWLFLDNNQLQCLPDTFNKLTNLQSLRLNNNQHGRTRLFIPDKVFELKKTSKLYIYAHNSQPFYNTFKSRFAQLYQSFIKTLIMSGIWSRKSEIKELFNNLSGGERNLVYAAISELAGIPSNDLAWGKAHAFKDLDRLQKAVGLVITRKFEALSPDEKNLVYGHMWSLAGESESLDQEWWKTHVFDSLGLLAEAISKLDDGELSINNNQQQELPESIARLGTLPVFSSINGFTNLEEGPSISGYNARLGFSSRMPPESGFRRWDDNV